MSSEDPEYSPFLKWNPDDPFSVDSVAQPFVSLTSMVRNGYEFDQELVSKASAFLSSLKRHVNPLTESDVFLKAIGQDSPDPAAVILSTPHLRDLSLIDDQGVMNDIRFIFNRGVWISSTDGMRYLSPNSDTDSYSLRNLVLREVLIPMEPSLVQISHNLRLLSWNEEFKDTTELLTKIFEVGAFHQPTLDFICSSRIPMAFQSLLSEVEDEDTHQYIILLISDNINKWKYVGVETARRGRILLQTLEREGFIERLEQTLLLDKASEDGRCVRFFSFKIMNYLGVNSQQPE
ncbi:hypothetical protein BLNAU_21908 [Blattamonas nauphoetae]|uniref:Uncharacterized protein n=1 Tax=Blattamonas nauphoetae TaxID=2049346 RepID=A0ABQ9WYU8_9EUKA|nr:hypothetical protein BLNAU_21908 [Blattamonas nauphoetae]